MRVVLDSNILVRANPHMAGPARRLLLRLVSEPGNLVLSRELLQELERALEYPRLVKRFQLSPAQVRRYIDDLAVTSRNVVPAHIPQGLIRDPKDEHVLGAALAGNADVLCTRDRHFWDENVLTFAVHHGIRMMTDLELLAILDAQTLED